MLLCFVKLLNFEICLKIIKFFKTILKNLKKILRKLNK